MATRIDVNVKLRGLLQFIKEVAQGNRQGQVISEADARVRAEANRKRQEKVAVEVPWPGAVPEGEIRPELAAYRTDGGGISLGWLDVYNTAGVGDTYTLISGDGSVAGDPVLVPVLPATAGVPSPVVPTWSGGWSAWTHSASFGAYFGSPCWWRTRKTTQLDITPLEGWGGITTERILLPAPSGMIWTMRVRSSYVRYHYTLRFTGPGTDAVPNRGVQLIPGADTDDPDALWDANPAQRRLLLQPLTEATVVVSPVIDTYADNAYHTYWVGARTVRELVTPPSITDLYVSVRGADATAPYTTGNNYTPNSSSPPIITYPLLRAATIDGVSYGQINHQSSTTLGVTYRMPVFTVPKFAADPGPSNPGLATSLSLGSLGICSVNKPSGFMRDIDTGATPVTLRVISGDLPPGMPEPYTSTLSEVLSAVAPLPSKFAFINVSGQTIDGIAEPGAQDAYPLAATAIRLPTYNPAITNLKSGAMWNSFADEDKPSQAGVPAILRKTMVPLASRVSTDGREPTLLASATYGQDRYCRSKLLALGFTPADLA